MSAAPSRIGLALAGVSAGGFIAAALANGITPRELCAAVIENRGEHGGVFRRSVLLQPAWGEQTHPHADILLFEPDLAERRAAA
jgi:hypothetical protein